VQAALAWWRETGSGSPRFLLLHLMEPHLSYDPPASVRHSFTGPGPPPVEVPFASDETFAALRSKERRLEAAELDYELRLYDEEILAVDRAIGQLLDGLERVGNGRAEGRRRKVLRGSQPQRRSLPLRKRHGPRRMILREPHDVKKLPEGAAQLDFRAWNGGI
jgi:hypothetical protein